MYKNKKMYKQIVYLSQTKKCILSAPNSVVVLNDNIVVLNGNANSKMYGTVEIPVFYFLDQEA